VEYEIILLQILLTWIYGHVAEYSLHRWALHKIGAKRGHPFSFHFYSHHKNSRLNSYKDSAYQGFPLRWDAAGKELLSLLGLLLLHSPLYFYFPWVFLTIVFSMCSYYYTHSRSHRDPEWAKKNIPWHFDHHMALNQNMNYGVRSDIIDRIMGTREKMA
jgi:sterol desaturase/sphingolipid hydroxylase (fatty acid hydroxylase superfamily)